MRRLVGDKSFPKLRTIVVLLTSVVFIFAGCRSEDVSALVEYINTRDRFANLTVEVNEVPLLYRMMRFLKPREHSFVVRGSVKTRFEYRVLLEIINRIGFEQSVRVAVFITESDASTINRFHHTFRGENSSVDNLLDYIELNKEFDSLVLEKLDIPTNSKLKDTGAKGDYLLMGTVSQSKHLASLVQLIYVADLRDRIILDVEVGGSWVPQKTRNGMTP